MQRSAGKPWTQTFTSTPTNTNYLPETLLQIGVTRGSCGSAQCAATPQNLLQRSLGRAWQRHLHDRGCPKPNRTNFTWAALDVLARRWIHLLLLVKKGFFSVKEELGQIHGSKNVYMDIKTQSFSRNQRAENLNWRCSDDLPVDSVLGQSQSSQHLGDINAIDWTSVLLHWNIGENHLREPMAWMTSFYARK